MIEYVQADGLIDGEIYAHFDQAFRNFVIPPGQTVNSGTFSNVVLTRGVYASLGIIPLGYMDVQAVSTTRYVGLVSDISSSKFTWRRIAVNGYQIPWLHVNQMHVTMDYNYDLLSFADVSSAMTASSSTNETPTSPSSSAEAASASAGNSTQS